MVPAKIAVFSFHPTLFMSLPGRAEFRFEPPVRAERDEAGRLLPPVAAQNFFHRSFQIVVPQDVKHAPEVMEAQLMRLQKCLLTGMEVGAMKCPGTGHAAQAKHMDSGLLSIDFCPHFIPVHLSFLPPGITLGNTNLVADLAELPFSFPHVSSN